MWFVDTIPPQDRQEHLQGACLHQGNTHKSYNNDLAISSNQDVLSKQVFATVWQSRSGPEHERTSYKYDSSPDQDLTTDPRTDDWHVVTLNEIQCIPASPTKQSNKLQSRLATPVCHGRAQFLRCGHSELPDMTAWLVWQQHEPLIIAREPSCILFEDSWHSEHSEHELFIGKSSIVGLLQTRSVEQIQLVLSAAYFVTTSFRTLQKYEVGAAVREFARSEMKTSSLIEKCSDDELLELCRPLLLSSSSNEVGFRTPSIARLLATSRIPGVKRGHGTMTQMCFNQIRRLGAMFILRPWTRFRTWFTSCTQWPLMRYVSKHWWCHYRLAAPSRSDLSADLISLINTALVGHSPHHTPLLLQGRVVDIGYSISQIYDLPELAAMYRNMGASESSHPGFPTRPKWQELKPVFGVRKPGKINTKVHLSVADVLNHRSICYIGEDLSHSITAQLQGLHVDIISGSAYDDHGEKDAAMQLHDTETAAFDEWEKLDFNDNEDTLVLPRCDPQEEWLFVQP